MTSALELLKYDENRKKNYISNIWAPISCGFLGFTAACYVNWTTRRPVFSGIQKHILATVILAGIGKVVDNYQNDYLAERDAVLRHYVELHPEYFPTPERQKFADVLLPWVPVR